MKKRSATIFSLFLLFFLFILFSISLVLLVILMINRKNDVSHSSRMFLHQEISSNGTTNNKISRLPQKLSEEEFLTYSSKVNDMFSIISNFGENEYECTGSCYCDGDQISMAIGMAKESFQNSCVMKLSDVCEGVSIKAEVTGCIETYYYTDEENYLNDLEKNGEIIFDCSGHCVTNPEFNPLKTSASGLFSETKVWHDCEHHELSKRLVYCEEMESFVMQHPFLDKPIRMKVELHFSKVDLGMFCGLVNSQMMKEAMGDKFERYSDFMSSADPKEVRRMQFCSSSKSLKDLPHDEDNYHCVKVQYTQKSYIFFTMKIYRDLESNFLITLTFTCIQGVFATTWLYCIGNGEFLCSVNTLFAMGGFHFMLEMLYPQRNLFLILFMQDFFIMIISIILFGSECQSYFHCFLYVILSILSPTDFWFNKIMPQFYVKSFTSLVINFLTFFYSSPGVFTDLSNDPIYMNRLNRLFRSSTIVQSVFFAIFQRYSSEKEEKGFEQFLTIFNTMKMNEFSFICRFSHICRTNLNGIINSLIMMEKSEEKELVDMNYTNYQLLKRCYNIVSLKMMTLVEYFKLKHKDYPIKLSICDIRKMINDLFEIQLNSFSDGKNDQKDKIRFEFSVSKDVPRVVVLDETLVSGVLSNVICNSVKYTEKGLISCKVEIQNIEEKNKKNEEKEDNNNYNNNEEEDDDEKEYHAQLCFTIKDTGSGIETERLDRIFIPYEMVEDHTGKKVKKPSFSIGLVIVKNILDQLNGEIKIDSEGIDKGTTVEISIPITFKKEEEFEEEEESEEEEEIEETEGEEELEKKKKKKERKEEEEEEEKLKLKLKKKIIQKRMRINNKKYQRKATFLIIDDNPINLEVSKYQIKKIFKEVLKRPCKVYTSKDGNIGLYELENLIKESVYYGSSFPIVITDIDMPQLDGIAMTGRIRKKYGMAVVVQAVTATVVFNKDVYKEKYLFDGVLQKPVGYEEMKVVVANCLQRNDQAQKIRDKMKLVEILETKKEDYGFFIKQPNSNSNTKKREEKNFEEEEKEILQKWGKAEEQSFVNRKIKKGNIRKRVDLMIKKVFISLVLIFCMFYFSPIREGEEDTVIRRTKFYYLFLFELGFTIFSVIWTKLKYNDTIIRVLSYMRSVTIFLSFFYFIGTGLEVYNVTVCCAIFTFQWVAVFTEFYISIITCLILLIISLYFELTNPINNFMYHRNPNLPPGEWVFLFVVFASCNIQNIYFSSILANESVNLKNDRRERWKEVIKNIKEMEETHTLVMDKISHDLVPPSSNMMMFAKEVLEKRTTMMIDPYIQKKEERKGRREEKKTRKEMVFGEDKMMKLSNVIEVITKISSEFGVREFLMEKYLIFCIVDLDIAMRNFIICCKIKKNQNIYSCNDQETTVNTISKNIGRIIEPLNHNGRFNIDEEIEIRDLRKRKKNKRKNKRKYRNKNKKKKKKKKKKVTGNEIILMDERNVMLILSNLVFNTFRHSLGNKIRIKYLIDGENKKFQFSIEDNGNGVTEIRRFLRGIEYFVKNNTKTNNSNNNNNNNNNLEKEQPFLRNAFKMTNTMGIGLKTCAYLANKIENGNLQFGINLSNGFFQVRFSCSFNTRRKELRKAGKLQNIFDPNNKRIIDLFIRGRIDKKELLEGYFKKKIEDIKVLVLDDMIINLESCSRHLVNFGFKNIIKTRKRDEAKKIMKNQRIEMLFIGYYLNSGETGVDVLQEFRRKWRWNIPNIVILLTGKEEVKRDIEYLERNNIDGCLRKPISESELSTLIPKCVLKKMGYY